MRLMFFTLMFMKDPVDHMVRDPLRRVSKVANLATDAKEAYRLAEEAIRILSEPDTRSMDKQRDEGRRIRWIDEEQGWLVLNGEYYEKMRKELGARLRKTQLQRDRRSKMKGKPIVSNRPTAQERVAEAYDKAGEPEMAERVAGMVPGPERSVVSPQRVPASVDPGLAAAGLEPKPDVSGGVGTAVPGMLRQKPASVHGAPAAVPDEPGNLPGPEFL